MTKDRKDRQVPPILKRGGPMNYGRIEAKRKLYADKHGDKYVPAIHPSRRLAEENLLSDLELIVINNQNVSQHLDVLKEARRLIYNSMIQEGRRRFGPEASEKIKKFADGRVIDYKWAKKELSDPTNEGYAWYVARHNGKVVASVVVDVYGVPRPQAKGTSPLVDDGKHQYTALYYVASADNKYQPALEPLVRYVMQAAKEFSLSKGKTNIGVITDDLISDDILKKIGAKYLGKLGVPTLDDIPDEDYEKVNFRKAAEQKISVVPFRKLTKSEVERMVARWLDEGYNQKAPGEARYKPLTATPSYKAFARRIDAQPGRYAKLQPLNISK